MKNNDHFNELGQGIVGCGWIGGIALVIVMFGVLLTSGITGEAFIFVFLILVALWGALTGRT